MNLAFEDDYNQFRVGPELGDLKPQLPIHLQLMERSEYMKKMDPYDSSSSLSPSSTPSSSGSELSEFNSPFLGKHRFSTYYEKSPFFKNPFSPNNKKAQKLSYKTSLISPESTKFVLVHDDKWLVYTICKDEPRLLCCGKINGEHGPNFDTLYKEVEVSNSKQNTFKSCALSERLLVLTCSDGSLRVHDVLENGKIVYQYEVGLQIESVDVSPKNDFIACGLQGRNKQTRGSIMLLITFEFKKHKMETLSPEIMAKLNMLNMDISLLDQQPVATYHPPQKKFLRKIGSKSSMKNLRKAGDAQMQQQSSISEPYLDLKIVKTDTKLITLPYRGIVDNVKFSRNGDKLIISTHKTESRFVIFDVTTPASIKLIMKSSRTPDTGSSTEGITDFELFGDDDRFMIISSNSPRAPPMMLGTCINNKTFDNNSRPVQPKRLIKLDGLGTNIHKCCVNSTQDLAAFLTTDGKIYLAHLGFDDDGAHKLLKLELIDKVSGSNNYKNSASMKFSKDGTKMFIVDLKGVLFVQDFSTILKKN